MNVREENAKNYASSKLAEMPSQTSPRGYSDAACAGRQSSKSLLLDHAEKLRRKANQLEALAYAVEHIQGDAEDTLYGLLSGDLYRQ